ncbi:hypothetical protein E2C01_018735 [Portunus trituberculatus]|uniref:Uncharacterized protein n=1 Tax=Portunus trituberculatus TaxID=210409 RepID=A0A5B7DWG8_PORTR|nr:hypothetical protein [Portunus trituberculatus]
MVVAVVVESSDGVSGGWNSGREACDGGRGVEEAKLVLNNDNSDMATPCTYMKDDADARNRTREGIK